MPPTTKLSLSPIHSINNDDGTTQIFLFGKEVTFPRPACAEITAILIDAAEKDESLGANELLERFNTRTNAQRTSPLSSEVSKTRNALRQHAIEMAQHHSQLPAYPHKIDFIPTSSDQNYKLDLELMKQVQHGLKTPPSQTASNADLVADVQNATSGKHTLASVFGITPGQIQKDVPQEPDPAVVFANFKTAPKKRTTAPRNPFNNGGDIKTCSGQPVRIETKRRRIIGSSPIVK